MRSPKSRCRIVSAARHEVARHADALVASARSEQRVDDVETIAAEIIPLADALAWIGRCGPATLKSRKVGLRGRPMWMWGVRSVVQRVPWGRVLVLGTWNYPILLSGVQIAQALAAGNSVWFKPAPGSEEVSRTLVRLFHDAGVPESVIQILGSDTQSAIEALSGKNGKIDLVVLTGSAATGRKVMHQAADQVTASIMELSGVDAVVAMPGSDWKRMVDLIRFGLLFNSGATCIGPRRLFYAADDSSANEALTGDLIRKLRQSDCITVHRAARTGVADAIESAIHCGGIDLVGKFDSERLRSEGEMFPVVMSNVSPNHQIVKTDLFAPVITLMPLDSMDSAVAHINDCPYRLAASVFGPTAAAVELAGRLNVGCITVNDLVAPTADPRLPFGGRGESGFGVTRGPEGLLAMTTPRVIATRSGRWVPHLSPRNDSNTEILTGTLQMMHGRTLRQRFAAFKRLTTAVRAGGGLKQSAKDRVQ
ncbi:aldehyde dehydrogenase family protein [Neorhodopirellula pilleata]|uniref:Putative succinate-semialdehyde dehydrogenase [NADP(+)] 2 n=1 Tax=Neorhodopirellula pilleata TaxID=2714738 RepID=A0A5C6AVZ2_9BACT|nr:aldehyde dehydrogenase family protein [Neorhodopirellula pilleata]TWU03236.1 putative succinate-semialdehyde dehydrogenase [NADP(+)] 2 [Neorhodopirellula pilleata]